MIKICRGGYVHYAELDLQKSRDFWEHCQFCYPSNSFSGGLGSQNTDLAYTFIRVHDLDRVMKIPLADGRVQDRYDLVVRLRHAVRHVRSSFECKQTDIKNCKAFYGKTDLF